ncbi:MAG: hypothetical protein AVDCRST_MAG87-2606 [uncultured Thermomicrobiales bacterium]|uniref:Uncharacterized protein n=1 Tax=uncultured Thermomicrobiales bacterium TaxID=1645740 RepID=A0A6J4VE11_9BACT|nr:MAG: hypothetical protein AVDCRST_MAG87-2606 [uncultured Thermomicrobiales bacterium]
MPGALEDIPRRFIVRRRCRVFSPVTLSPGFRVNTPIPAAGLRLQGGATISHGRYGTPRWSGRDVGLRRRGSSWTREECRPRSWFR